MNELLKGRIAVVTGGTRGIGKAIAKRFLEQGARVVIIGVDEGRGKAALEELKGGYFYKINVADREEVKKGFQQIAEEVGAIEILVNNAGITRDNLLMKMGAEEWDQVLGTNLDSLFYTCQNVIRPMMKARFGRIINITSVVGLIGNAGQTNYAAAKAGMIGFTKALAKEIATRGVTVNCIAPGFIQTDMTDKLNEAQKGMILGQIPMQRLGEVSDIADAALFLAAPLSSYITGQTLAVDGGMAM